MLLRNKIIVIIGGSSGIGFAIAKLALKEKSNVIIASRSLEKLESAKKRLNGNVKIKQVNICHENSLKKFFKEIRQFDHLQITASETHTIPFLTTPTVEAREIFVSKFWGQYNATRYAIPYLNKKGSITLYSGRLSQRPIGKDIALLSAVNSAVEGLGRALAVELAPIRVNIISPGMTNTEIFSQYSQHDCKKLFETVSKQFIIKRVAEPEEIAEASIFLMKSTFMTGGTIFIDGGYTFR